MHGKTHPDTPVHGKRLYNSKETRVLLGGISRSTFQRLIASGALEARKQGRSVVVTQQAIDAYIDRLPPVTEADPVTELEQTGAAA